LLWNIKLSNGEGNKELKRRHRGEEEDLLAQLILSSVHHFDSSLSKDNNTFGHDFLLDRSGDELNLVNFEGMQFHQERARFEKNSAQNVIDAAGFIHPT
jgi:hypothetical protein